MPVISVKFLEGFFNQEQKKQMIVKLTEAFVECTMPGTRPYINVMIEEVKSQQWGLGGRPIPDWEWMINGYPEILEDATTELSEQHGIAKRKRLT